MDAACRISRPPVCYSIDPKSKRPFQQDAEGGQPGGKQQRLCGQNAKTQKRAEKNIHGMFLDGRADLC